MKHDDDAHLIEVDSKTVFAITRPDDNLFYLYFIYCLLSNIAFPIVFLPLYFRFKTLRYRFDNEGIAVSHGILWRQETYLTYSRIQDIHVSRNIFERWLGLGTVQIQTASGNSSAEEAIVGVRQYNEIRNFLYSRMRGQKVGAAAQPLVAVEQSVDDMLAGIRDELRVIRELVEGKRHV
ncbi:MAG: PH domain-containing protein [Acidobacteria bacterium]|nr:PH domain-containing protein [Acidobacteriota bacterium]